MVLQLCGRVCRRLSFENPVSYEMGFFVLEHFVGFTAKGAIFKSCVYGVFLRDQVQKLGIMQKDWII